MELVLILLMSILSLVSMYLDFCIVVTIIFNLFVGGLAIDVLVISLIVKAVKENNEKSEAEHRTRDTE